MISLTLPHILLALTTLISIVVTSAIPSPASTDLPPSQCDTATPMLGSDQPVDPIQHSDWRGRMSAIDCRNALYIFRHNFLSYAPNRPTIFWSRDLTTKPTTGDNFALPYQATFQTCTVLLRMAKDFGNNVLPLRNGGYLPVSNRQPQATFRANDILWVLDDMRRERQSLTTPIWTTGLGLEGGNAVVMIIPSASTIARRWASDSHSQRTTLVIQGSVTAVGNETSTGDTATS